MFSDLWPSNYYFLKSVAEPESSWMDVLYDALVCVGSLLAGGLVYVAVHGMPITTVTIDVDKLNERNPEWCYSTEEARKKYGDDEGREFGEDVQICGHKLPKYRALKYMVSSGPKVAAIWDKLSWEERHALMTGMAQLPESVMHESLKEFCRGSNGKKCDGCRTADKEAAELKVCGRCQYTVCPQCEPDLKLGRCFCKDANFGIPYPPPAKRKFYQKGMW